jgi:4-carboxymuconolactone decarboxylase
MWVRNPGLAAGANQLGNALRLSGKLDAKPFELAILIVARQWSAQYEWYAHAKDAAKVGLDADVVEAIRTRQIPVFKDAQQKLVYEIVNELLETKDLSAASYARALKTFSIDLVMEIVSVTGFYTLVAMMLKAFDAPVPGDARPLD